MTSVSLATFLAGIGVGLAVAVPIGPMGVLCIQRTLAFGLAAGLATGLAAATVQVTYGVVAVLGFSPSLTVLIGAGVNLLSVVSAALLFWFAYRIIRREVTVGGFTPGGHLHLARSYRDALTFGFTNPLTVVLFFAAFPALTSAENLLEAPLLVGGVFAGVVGWYVVLSAAVALLRDRLPEHALNLINKAAGLSLACLGGVMLANAFG
jgi:threonine/homoserine/homoserine lactone efflux protein